MDNMHSLWRKMLGYPVIILLVILSVALPIQAQLSWPDSPTLLASGRAYGAGSPKILIGADGQRHALWAENPPGHSALMYTHTLADSSDWSSPKTVLTGNPRAKFWLVPAAVIDPVGNLHIVILQTASDGTRSLRYLVRSGETWQSPQTIYTLRATGDPLWGLYAPRMALDSKGKLHLVWVDEVNEQRRVFYGRQMADGTWSPAVELTKSADSAQYVWPDIVGTPDG